MSYSNMWRLDFEDYFYKIYDSKKQIAGYFDPDYGVPSSADELEQIRLMHKNSAKITRGFLTVGLVKFGIFTEESMMVDKLAQQVEQAFTRIIHWKEFVSTFANAHSVSVSHTDQDMLSITIEIIFDAPIVLEKNLIHDKLEPILDRMQGLGLL